MFSVSLSSFSIASWINPLYGQINTRSGKKGQENTQLRGKFGFAILEVKNKIQKELCTISLYTWALTLAPNSKRHWITSSSPQQAAKCKGVCPSWASSSPSPLGPGFLGLFTSQPLKQTRCSQFITFKPDLNCSQKGSEKVYKIWSSNCWHILQKHKFLVLVWLLSSRTWW